MTFNQKILIASIAVVAVAFVAFGLNSFQQAQLAQQQQQQAQAQAQHDALAQHIQQCESMLAEINHAKTGLSYNLGINTNNVNAMIDEYNAQCAGNATNYAGNQ